jgi:Glyoxalase-like domain
MMKLDHIVIGTRDLNEGARYLESCLRCTLAPGGQHIGFGTHNRLLNLGGGAYLELIALDPVQVDNPAMPIKYKAPFGLGNPEVQATIANDPQLLAWVVATDNIAQYASLFEHIGTPTTMRRGEMQWTITHRSDGQPVPAGLPTFIDWGDLSGGAMHPSERLPASAVSLAHLKSSLSQEHLPVFTPLFQQDHRLAWLGSEQSISAQMGKNLQARLKIGEGEYFEF